MAKTIKAPDIQIASPPNGHEGKPRCDGVKRCKVAKA